MSSQNSANLVAAQDNKMSKENRHLADFNPNFWGDILLPSLAEMNIDAKAHLQYEELKQQVRRMLVISTDKPYHNLDIIDAIQRLGVAYHFEKEIEEEALHIIYHHHCNNAQIDDDLYTASGRSISSLTRKGYLKNP
ncbi:(+)-delta-cadinene synthase isozyme A-like [Gossypium australe]|uniref:(+)-delta-cadinene synthase isozyme A-like n=1 Tax=Gossypium australe TaxID=47621 RepID=A0A5B6VTD9_9ROSI|nr:(+)-delta-cadinene synthase isozyme A-like [Gossypium australe]